MKMKFFYLCLLSLASLSANAQDFVEADYPGGREAMQEFFQSKLKYPESALAQRISGVVYVDVTINEKGKASDIAITSPSLYPDIDAEAVRVVKLVKKWQPRIVNGKAVKTKIFVPVNFNPPPVEPKEPVYEHTQTKLRKSASYPGGAVEMTIFISKNTKYPKKELKANVEGDVYVKFIVAEDGSVTNPEIHESVSAGLDAEAIRIVSIMPKWEPAIDSEGNPIATEMIIPVNFRTPKPLDGIPPRK